MKCAKLQYGFGYLAKFVQSLSYLFTVKMILAGKRVDWIVIDYRSVILYHAYPYVIEGMEIAQTDIRYVFTMFQFRKDIGVYHLKLGVHFIRLELFFTVVLESDEAPHEK